MQMWWQRRSLSLSSPQRSSGHEKMYPTREKDRRKLGFHEQIYLSVYLCISEHNISLKVKLFAFLQAFVLRVPIRVFPGTYAYVCVCVCECVCLKNITAA